MSAAEIPPLAVLEKYGVGWEPPAGDALHLCGFDRAGFRACSLAGPGGNWRLVLSRVDVADRDPRGLVTAYAPEHPSAFQDLDGHVLVRTVSLFSGTSLRQAAGALASRLGGPVDDWTRRLDYLSARTLRELQAARTGLVLTGTVERPTGSPHVIAGRVRQGRTFSLFGPGGSLKTVIAEGLAVSLLTGLEVIPGWYPTRRYTVGVLDWDEGAEEWRVRVFAILRGIGRTALPTPYFYQPMACPLEDAADEIGRWIVENGIEVLFVSPVNRALRPASGDPGAPVFALYDVLKEFGTTNLLIDHVAGANIENPGTAREYGSVAKRDSARGSYSVFVRTAKPGECVVVLRNTKPDALAPGRPPQVVRVTFEPPWPDAAGCYDAIRFSAAEVASRSILAGPKESQVDRFVRLVSEHGPIDAAQLAKLGGFDARRLRDLAYKARQAGHPVEADHAGIYRTSSEGM